MCVCLLVLVTTAAVVAVLYALAFVIYAEAAMIHAMTAVIRVVTAVIHRLGADCLRQNTDWRRYAVCAAACHAVYDTRGSYDEHTQVWLHYIPVTRWH